MILAELAEIDELTRTKESFLSTMVEDVKFSKIDDGSKYLL